MEHQPPVSPGSSPANPAREGNLDFPAYDAAAALAGIRAAGGSWSDLDAEALKADLYRAREEGTRSLDRP